MVERLLYRSENCVGRESLAIIDIVSAALRRNATLAITGVLYFDDDCFIQYIEGDRSGVETLMSSLRQDTRHVMEWEVRLDPARERVFPRIDMGFVDGSRRDFRAPDIEKVCGLGPEHAEQIVAALADLPIKTSGPSTRPATGSERVLFRSPPGDSPGFRIEPPPPDLLGDASTRLKRGGR